MRQAEAHAALTRFVHARAARGDRTLLVITGKGLKKVNGDATVRVLSDTSGGGTMRFYRLRVE